MRRLMAWSVMLAAGIAAGCTQTQNAPVALDYPQAHQGDVVDDYHGVQVADPYRWLEDPDSPETRAWIEAENEVTNAFLASIPERDKIRKRLTQLWDYEKYSVPRHKGGRYFFYKNDGLQNQSVLYTTPALDQEPKILIDPNVFSADGTVALSGTSVSEDAKYIAYAASDGGSDWMTWRVRDIESGVDLDDVIEWSKFSGASWTQDGSGFYYSRYDAPEESAKLQSVNEFQKLYFHRLGTSQTEDTLVYDRPDHKDWGFGGSVTDDGRYLIIHISKGTERKNLVFYQDLETGGSPVVELISDFNAQYNFIDNDGPVFWFFTDHEADRGRIIAIDTRQPGRANWKEIISEADETLEGAGVVHDTFVLSYLKDAHTQVRMHSLDGTLQRDLPLPGIGAASGFGGRRGDTETFYSFTGYNMPKTVYRYDFLTGQSSVFRKPKVDFSPDAYVTQQVFFASKDGTKVPMFITHRKGLELNGKNPTYLYGYGGFNISIKPFFSVSNLVWMEMGGVLAVANIRGGGEYGRSWHEAGMKLVKQNVFDDFFGAAQWLIDNQYTSNKKLAIAGGSNGGLLVGACMTQRPELFAAALPAVGVLDMLRFHKFTIGWAWVSDYGSPDNAEEFEALYAYSPLHNLKEGTHFPATLITTADHDDRVVPAHSFKFAAALQAAHRGDNPVLIRIETRAGHGAGKPTTKRIEETADKFSFLVRTLGMKPQW